MRTYLSVLLCGIIAATLSLQVEARGGSGGSGGSSASGSQGNSGNRGSSSGRSSDSNAADNANGQFSQEKTTSLDHGQDRMSEAGQENQTTAETPEHRWDNGTVGDTPTPP